MIVPMVSSRVAHPHLRRATHRLAEELVPPLLLLPLPTLSLRLVKTELRTNTTSLGSNVVLLRWWLLLLLNRLALSSHPLLTRRSRHA